MYTRRISFAHHYTVISHAMATIVFTICVKSSRTEGLGLVVATQHMMFEEENNLHTYTHVARVLRLRLRCFSGRSTDHLLHLRGLSTLN